MALPKQISRQLLRYFQYKVSASIKVTPPPSNAKEAQHLYDNFKKIAPLEYFSIAREKSGVVPYDSYIKVVFSGMKDSELENEYLREEATPRELESESEAENQQHIIDRLSRLMALPRYSYIENDEKYFAGLEEIQFKHHLPLEALKFEKTYRITSSTVDNQFMMVEGIEQSQMDYLRRKVRHNFQKFHKFESVRWWKGDSQASEGGGYK